MDRTAYDPPSRDELLQALQGESCCIDVYAAALSAADAAHAREWSAGLDAARSRRDALLRMLDERGIDPGAMTPGRGLAMRHGDALVQAIDVVRQDGNPEAARAVAGECIVLAETLARPCRARIDAWLAQDRVPREERVRETPAGALALVAAA